MNFLEKNKTILNLLKSVELKKNIRKVLLNDLPIVTS